MEPGTEVSVMNEEIRYEYADSVLHEVDHGCRPGRDEGLVDLVSEAVGDGDCPAKDVCFCGEFPVY